MRIVRYSINEKKEILTHSFLTINEIQILCDCGKSTAQHYKAAFKGWQAERKIKLFDERKIPTELFMEFAKEFKIINSKVLY